MSLRQIRHALQNKKWVLEDDGAPITGTPFQRQRIARAMTVARLYLGTSFTVRQIARSLKVTDERAAQIVRLGIKSLEDSGRLRRAAASTSTSSAQSETKQP